LFGQIVAPLVDAINQAFNTSNLLVARLRGTGSILCVPKLEIRQVLLGHRPLESGE
jgi:hypothetical protein